MGVLRNIRSKVKHCVWRIMAKAAAGSQMEFGPIKVFFCLFELDRGRVNRQLRAMEDARKLFTCPSADRYRQLLFAHVHEIIVADAARDKYEAGEGFVLLRYAPGHTDNYVYLASRLVEIASLMASQSDRLPTDERNRRAREAQLDFLSGFPEACSVSMWLTQSREESQAASGAASGDVPVEGGGHQ
jgi:hypothetical protein